MEMNIYDVINQRIEYLMNKMFEFDCVKKLNKKQQEEYDAIATELEKLIKIKKGV